MHILQNVVLAFKMSQIISIVLILFLSLIAAIGVSVVVFSFGDVMPENSAIVGATATPYKAVYDGGEQRGVDILLYGSSKNIDSIKVVSRDAPFYSGTYYNPQVGVVDPIYGTPYNFFIPPQISERIDEATIDVIASYAGAEQIILTRKIDFEEITPSFLPQLNTTKMQTVIPGHGTHVFFPTAEFASKFTEFWVEIIANGETIKLYSDDTKNVTYNGAPVANKPYFFYIKPSDANNPISTAWQDGALNNAIVNVYGTTKDTESVFDANGVLKSGKEILLSSNTANIPAREGMFDGSSYVSGIEFNKVLDPVDSKTGINIKIIPSNNDEWNTNKRIGYVLKDKGEVKINVGYEGADKTEQTFKYGGELNLAEYSNDAELTVYVRRDNIPSGKGNTFGWYEIGSVKIGDLK